MNVAPWKVQLRPAGGVPGRGRLIELQEGRNLITTQRVHSNHSFTYGAGEDPLCYIVVERRLEYRIEPIGDPDIELNRNHLLHRRPAVLRDHDEIAFLLPYAVSRFGLDVDFDVCWFRYTIAAEIKARAPSARARPPRSLKRPSLIPFPALDPFYVPPKRYQHDHKYLTRLLHTMISS